MCGHDDVGPQLKRVQFTGTGYGIAHPRSATVRAEEGLIVEAGKVDHARIISVFVACARLVFDCGHDGSLAELKLYWGDCA